MVAGKLAIWDADKMKMTLEIPDELFREVKATAALKGMKLKDFVAESLRSSLQKKSVSAAKPASATARPKAGGRFADGCGIVSSGIGDLSSNPKHMERFGRV